MRVLISGSTGFIGDALVRRLSATGHQPVRLVRSNPPDSVPSVRWNPAERSIEPGALDGIDAVVHLAGESIASSRWTDAQKARILDSRVDTTTTLADAIATASNPPSVFLCGSAIGLYGDRGDERVDETSSASDDFAAVVSQSWEAAAQPAETDRTRVAYLRTGIVLDPSGGALREQLPFFRLGLGGRIGSGRQWFSWISLRDEVDAILHLLQADDVTGPVNLTAPNPVTNAEFTKALGSALGRPTLLPTPRIALWARLGRELSRTLLEGGAHVSPGVLLASGYQFVDPEIRPALDDMLR
ncbi:MAG: TIGR01777 family oxidoreductase [Acidimicrobiales bacterium]|nr:TIGR01777 family oxidoreductase [Acidimicrobiales bacterium]